MELDTNQHFETLIPGFYITIEIRNYNRQYATTLNIFTNNNNNNRRKKKIIFAL